KDRHTSFVRYVVVVIASDFVQRAAPYAQYRRFERCLRHEMLHVPLTEADQPSASAICRHSIRALGFSRMQRWNVESLRVDGPRGFPSWQAPQSQPFRRLPASPATRANLEYPS